MPGFSVINDNELLTQNCYDNIIHIRMKTEGLYNKAEVSPVDLIYVGTYSYRTTSGGKKTVQSYAVHNPLTREQFKDALAKGFDLEKRRKKRR